MYPKLCSWLLFKKNPDGQYTVRDCYREMEYTVGSGIAYFARKLDGRTDPFSVLPGCPRREVQEMLDALNKNEFLRYGRVLESSKGSITYSLIMPKKYRTKSIIPVLTNYLLLVLWLPTLLFGLGCFINNLPDVNNGSALLGQWSAIIIGAILHEVGHATAALCYGGRVFEAGVLLQNYMPGAYVMIDDTPVKKRLQKAQILAAGVEMNMLLSGIGWLLCVYIPCQSGLFFGFALANLLLALLNLTFSEDLDGMAVMGKLMGIDCSFVALAKYTLAHKEERLRLLKAGPHGFVELIICGLLIILQIVIPSIYLMYILELIECFF